MPSAQAITRAFSAAGFDCFELRGLKQAGGFLAGDPLASSPYPKAFRVSTSEEFQPRRCGASNQARLKPRINRAPYYYVHLRAANQKYYPNIFPIARTFLPSISDSRTTLGRPFFSRRAVFDAVRLSTGVIQSKKLLFAGRWIAAGAPYPLRNLKALMTNKRWLKIPRGDCKG